MSTRIDTCTSAVVHHSYMNPSIEITKDKWAVTIAVEKEPYLHTILLIETFKEKRINYKAHLMGPSTSNGNGVDRAALKDAGSPYCSWGTVPRVELKEISKKINPSRYVSGCYKTWSVDWDQVQKMLDEIEEENDHPEKINRPFHIFGEQSIFAPTKIDFDIDDERLLEMREKEPEKFVEMYAYYEDKKAWINHEYNGTNIPIRYPFAKALMGTTKPFLSSLQDGFDKGNLGKVSGILVGMILLFPILLPVNLVLAVPAYAIDMPRMANEDKEMKKNGELLRLFDSHVKKLELASQNCFNWARCKLSTIDIKVKEHSSEWLASIPTAYFSDKRETRQDNQN